MIRSSLESKLYIALGSKQDLPSESVTNRRHLSRSLVVVLVCLLAVVLLAYRTRGLTFRWDLFVAALEQVDWRWMAMSICLILLSIFLRALRWRVMLSPFRAPARLWRLISDTAIGLTAGVLLGRVGEVVRPYLIAIHARLPPSSQAAAWLLERMLDLLAILFLCGFAFIRLRETAFVAGGYALMAAGAACFVVLLAFRDPRRYAEQRILSALTFLPEQQQRRAKNILDAFARGMECTRNAQSMVSLVGYTLLVWLSIWASIFALFHGFPETRGFGLGNTATLLGFMALGSTVQLPGIGGGLQAAAIVGLTRLYGIRMEPATGIALLLWVIGSLAVVPFGIGCAFHEGLNWSRLKLLSKKQILDETET